MKIVSKVSPLIFCFDNTDRLIDALHALRNMTQKTALSQLKKKYYLTVHSTLSKRKDTIRLLCEYGSLCGRGIILDAYIEEHGKRISHEVDFKAVI